MDKCKWTFLVWTFLTELSEKFTALIAKRLQQSRET